MPPTTPTPTPTHQHHQQHQHQHQHTIIPTHQNTNTPTPPTPPTPLTPTPQPTSSVNCIAIGGTFVGGSGCAGAVTFSRGCLSRSSCVYCHGLPRCRHTDDSWLYREDGISDSTRSGAGEVGNTVMAESPVERQPPTKKTPKNPPKKPHYDCAFSLALPCPQVNANGQIETVDGNCCQIIYRSGRVVTPTPNHPVTPSPKHPTMPPPNPKSSVSFPVALA